ncbi:hypothetical protein COLO4_15421 [Corchorus olitorius]|uniref:Uncharacterized protein n=1 Tax=Corchorus olitorius TaxID=93759 RepID=A0A1R3JNF6_9ROSI|nr:hypothetical protein COLO4_15421 [Corchorus olitorius]
MGSFRQEQPSKDSTRAGKNSDIKHFKGKFLKERRDFSEVGCRDDNYG